MMLRPTRNDQQLDCLYNITHNRYGTRLVLGFFIWRAYNMNYKRFVYPYPIHDIHSCQPISHEWLK